VWIKNPTSNKAQFGLDEKGKHVKIDLAPQSRDRILSFTSDKLWKS